MSSFGRAPRTVLGELVPGVLDPGAATRILCVVRAPEASSLTTWPYGYGQRLRGGPEPSLLKAAVALRRRTGDPTDADIDEVANVCRCGTYFRIREAIKSAAAKMG